MTPLSIKKGDFLPKFSLESTSGELITNDKLLGKNVLLFIYPKDNTSSCTKEAQEFSSQTQYFLNGGISIFGISKDSINSHNKFISKYGLKLELLSDERLTFISAIGAWVEKSMYGKKYMGVERTTLFISKDGKILEIWRKVKVLGHVKNVLLYIKKINE